MIRRGLTTDELWPREPAYRYRLYARIRDDLQVLAAAADLPSIGQAIATIDEETEGGLVELGRIGILDAIRHRWVVKPWDRGEHL